MNYPDIKKSLKAATSLEDLERRKEDIAVSIRAKNSRFSVSQWQVILDLIDFKEIEFSYEGSK